MVGKIALSKEIRSKRSKGTVKNSDRISVIRNVLKNNHANIYDINGDGDDDGHGDNNETAKQAGSKKAVYMAKKR